MKLFYLRHACSLAPHILINELGIKVDLERMDSKNKAPILKYNPKGQVPTLVIEEGKVLTETPVILQYLADLKPEKDLIPKVGTWERYRCLEWLNYVTSELHKAFNPFFGFAKDLDDSAKSVFRKALERKYAFLNTHLEKNKYLMGSKLSVADFYCFTVINWSKGAQIDLSQFPALHRFWEEIKSRPTTQAAMNGEERAPV